MWFANFCLESFLIRRIWGLFPSRCQYPGCENRYLRWTEHRVEALNSDQELVEWYHICNDCVHKLRQHAFKSGWEQVEIEGVELSFCTDSESERPEPLE